MDGCGGQSRRGAQDRLLLPAVGAGGRVQVLLPEDPAEEGGTRQRARRQESVNAEKSSKSIAEVCKYL